MFLLCLHFMMVLLVTSDRETWTQKVKGVSMEKQPLYDLSQKRFQCLDGSKLISIDYVNDDYCDCNDGSDEPGTSACPNASFHCINLGHVGTEIPSFMVNDEVCDCCDGSDEHRGYIKCPNVCEELGKKVREESERLKKLKKEGLQRRAQLVKDGQKAIADKRKRIEELKKEMAEMDTEKDTLEIDTHTAEREASKERQVYDDKALDDKRTKDEEDKARGFARLDANDDGKITYDEVQAIDHFDKDNDGEVTIEEAKEWLNNEEPDKERFLRYTYIMIKHVLVKIEKEEKEDKEDAGDPESDEDDTEKYPEDVRALIEKAEDLRAQYRNISDQYKALTDEEKKIEEFLDLDFGKDNCWATLYGQCYEYETKEYVYRFCPFEKSAQRKPGRGTETSLGLWSHWAGDPEDAYSAQMYDRGQACHNGPDRTTRVEFECSNNHKLVSSSEPSRCEYLYIFETPAACNPETDSDQHKHEEL